MSASLATTRLRCLLIGDDSPVIQCGGLSLTHEYHFASTAALRASNTETARQEVGKRRRSLPFRFRHRAS